MTNIELFKKIIRYTNGKEFDVIKFAKMLINHPEFSKLNIKFRSDDIPEEDGFLESVCLSEENVAYEPYPCQVFHPNVINDLARVNKTECIDLINAFEKYMIQLNTSLNGVDYKKGDLFGTSDIGCGDIKAIIRVGLHWTYDDLLVPTIRMEYITPQFDLYSTNNLYCGSPECTKGTSTYVCVDIPEHRWYHAPGKTEITSCIFFSEKDFTVENIHNIRDEIVRMRTIVSTMELTNPRLS
jgi:hypothetical protein